MMTKKYSAILLALVLCISMMALAACGGGEEPPVEPDIVEQPETDPGDGDGIDGQEVGADDSATFSEIQGMYSLLTGYWNASDGYFYVFDQMDAHTLLFNEGIWATGGGRDYGQFVWATTPLSYEPGVGTGLLFHWHEEEANEMNDAMEAMDAIIYVDLSEIGEGKLKVRGEDSQWIEAVYAGSSQEEAYEAFFNGLE